VAASTSTDGNQYGLVARPAVAVCLGARAAIGSGGIYLAVSGLPQRGRTFRPMVPVANWQELLARRRCERGGVSRQGPVQSNGMCLLEFVVHWNL
jgi:hypothetical protein